MYLVNILKVIKRNNMTGIIYCAENSVNDKIYIGQTINTLKQRINGHKRTNKTNNYFHNALIKHSDWNWTILQEYNCNKEKMGSVLNKAERYYISIFDSFKNGYNGTEGGSGSIGRKHTEETKRKISEGGKGRKLSKETKRKMSKFHKGTSLSKETKDKISKFHKEKVLTGEHKRKISEGGKGRTHTEETKRKMSKEHKGKKFTEEAKKNMSESRRGDKNHMHGKHHTKESKRKMSESHKNKK